MKWLKNICICGILILNSNLSLAENTSSTANSSISFASSTSANYSKMEEPPSASNVYSQIGKEENKQNSGDNIKPSSSMFSTIMPYLSLIISLILILFYAVNILPKIRILENQLKNLNKDKDSRKTLSVSTKSNPQSSNFDVYKLIKKLEKRIDVLEEANFGTTEYDLNTSEIYKNTKKPNTSTIILEEDGSKFIDEEFFKNGEPEAKTKLGELETKPTQINSILPKSKSLNIPFETFYFDQILTNNINLLEGSETELKTSLFRVDHYDDDKWTLTFIENPNMMSKVLRNLNQILSKACTIQNYAEDEPHKVENVEPGILQPNGNFVTIIEKAVVILK